MYAYKFVGDIHSENCPNDYDWKQVVDKYKRGQGCNFGLDLLLEYGCIKYAGWCYVFHGDGELRRYLYLLGNGDTGVAWAPNVKLLEKGLGHKVQRAFWLDKEALQDD